MTVVVTHWVLQANDFCQGQGCRNRLSITYRLAFHYNVVNYNVCHNKVVRTDFKVHFRVSWVLQPENLLSKMNQAIMLKEKVAETDFEWHIAMR